MRTDSSRILWMNSLYSWSARRSEFFPYCLPRLNGGSKKIISPLALGVFIKNFTASAKWISPSGRTCFSVLMRCAFIDSSQARPGPVRSSSFESTSEKLDKLIGCLAMALSWALRRFGTAVGPAAAVSREASTSLGRSEIAALARKGRGMRGVYIFAGLGAASRYTGTVRCTSLKVRMFGRLNRKDLRVGPRSPVVSRGRRASRKRPSSLRS